LALRAGIRTLLDPSGYGITDGIANYMSPSGVILTGMDVPEPIQPITRHSFRRNPVRTDFTP
jgi:hypothetical protein